MSTIRSATPGVAAPEADVPAGRYAIVDEADGRIRFFVVDRPTEGRWAGRVFVSEQASDEKFPVRGARRGEVLAAIAVDPREAMIRYGHELGRCGNCGRTLTDETSRAMGIGPDCARALGIDRTPLFLLLLLGGDRLVEQLLFQLFRHQELEHAEVAVLSVHVDPGVARRPFCLLVCGQQGVLEREHQALGRDALLAFQRVDCFDDLFTHLILRVGRFAL